MNLLLAIIISVPNSIATTLRIEAQIVEPSGVVESAAGLSSPQGSHHRDVKRGSSPGTIEPSKEQTLSYNVVSYDAPGRCCRNYTAYEVNHIMSVLCSTIAAAATGFDHLFSKVDVFVDVNPEHRHLDYLRSCGPVHIVEHANLSNPFSLPHQHRDRIRHQVEDGDYDWFLYTEDDVVVPSVAMRTHMELCQLVPRPCNVGFVRVVDKVAGHVGETRFGDIHGEPRSLCPVWISNQCFVQTYWYSAVWMYDRIDTQSMVLQSDEDKKMEKIHPQRNQFGKAIYKYNYRSRESAIDGAYNKSNSLLPCNIIKRNVQVWHDSVFLPDGRFNKKPIFNGANHWKKNCSSDVTSGHLSSRHTNGATKAAGFS